MPLNHLLEPQDEQTKPASSVPGLANPEKVEASYCRSIQPDLESLPIATRLTAGLLTGLKAIALSLLLIWAATAAATLATARPETLDQSIRYAVLFPVNILLTDWLRPGYVIVTVVGIVGLLRPSRRSPETLSFALWLALMIWFFAPLLVNPRNEPIWKATIFVLLGIFCALASGVFYFVFRKATTSLAKKLSPRAQVITDHVDP